VGYHVAREAVVAGHDVVAVCRPGRTLPERVRALGPAGPLSTRGADLGDRDALARALDGADALIHCAAVYAYGKDQADEVARVNVDGTRAIVEAAATAGLDRVVVTSSAVTRGSSPTAATRTEADRLGDEPAPAYYASKARQEEVALEAADRHGLHLALALPTVVLGGPFSRLGPSNAIVLRYLLDPTRSTYPGGSNVVDARDVGAGHLLLLERGEPGQRYLLGGEDVTWRELHSLVANLAGLPGPYLEAPSYAAWLASAAAEAWGRLTSTAPLSTTDEASTIGRYYWYSSARAGALGYAPRPARTAVAASLAWLALDESLPRWVREGLRMSPEVRSARLLIPRPVDGEDGPAAAGDGIPVRDPGAPVSPRRPPRRRPPRRPR
jgi:dihydroflavonol-4-reductase